MCPQKRVGCRAQDQSLRRHQRRQHRRGEQDLQLQWDLGVRGDEESLWPNIHPVSSYWIVLFIQLPARIMIIPCDCCAIQTPHPGFSAALFQAWSNMRHARRSENKSNGTKKDFSTITNKGSRAVKQLHCKLIKIIFSKVMCVPGK